MSSDTNPFAKEIRELERSGDLAKFRNRLVFAPAEVRDVPLRARRSKNEDRDRQPSVAPELAIARLKKSRS